MFCEVEVIGMVSAVDKMRAGDPPHNRHFRRRDGPHDEVSSFDEKRFAAVSRKCMNVTVCRVCRTVGANLGSLPEDGKGMVPYRSIYAAGSDELAIARMWERVRVEEKQKESEFSDEAYRTLLAMQALCDAGTLSLWDLSKEMNVFNHRSLERPVTHILGQCPDLGILDRKALVLQFRDPSRAAVQIQDLIERYERFYDQREVRMIPPQQPSQNREVLFRIKKLNQSSESMSLYSKW